jgi:imidazolonepropionase
MLEDAGTIEPGKRADLIILNTDDYRKIPYEYGSRLVDTVFIAGEPVMRNGVMQL